MSEPTIDTKVCAICKRGKTRNRCLSWHIDPDTGSIWVWCQGVCQRGYSIYDYCHHAGISLKDLLQQNFDFQESTPNEVQQMGWPQSFLPLYHSQSAPGIEYLRSRSIEPDDGLYYDTYRNGIVFPYYYDNAFCGAQIRLIKPWISEEGSERKIDTLPGTRTGILIYGWNQTPLHPSIRGIIVTEGAFNALAIQQSLNATFGGVFDNPWKVVACSGSGTTAHHLSIFKELKDEGRRVIAAPDSDTAGLKMLAKLKNHDAITHFALTGEDDVDWNDVRQQTSKEEFARWFLGRIKHV